MVIQPQVRVPSRGKGRGAVRNACPKFVQRGEPFRLRSFKPIRAGFLEFAKGNIKSFSGSNGLPLPGQIKQFGITSTEDYCNDNNGVFAPDDFTFSMPGDYLVLTAKKEFFELFEYLARESGVKLKRPPKEYKGLVDSAVKRFEKSVKSKEKCSYFFVSKEQMEKLIEKRARSQVKAERAIEGVVARALASEETLNEG